MYIYIPNTYMYVYVFAHKHICIEILHIKFANIGTFFISVGGK